MNREVMRIMTENTMEIASSMSTRMGGMGTMRMTISPITPVASAMSPERRVSITCLMEGSEKPAVLPDGMSVICGIQA
ncbi:hypothetical protein D3C71_2155480 [compost metagenome]